MAQIFVYGTLKRGQRAHGLLQNFNARFLRSAETAEGYHLRRLGWFPGMIADRAVGGTVSGELYEADEAALAGLDAYESVDSGLFRRGEVLLSDGSKALAYFFNQPVASYPRIEEGVWL